MIRISVITPCYNDGCFLEEALQSVQSDKYGAYFEHIIVNDGSTDAFTLQKLSDLEAGGYTVIHQPNQGPAVARNTAIKVAKGDYILPLDSDNKIIPEVFVEAMEILDANKNIDVIHTYFQYFGSKNWINEGHDFDLVSILHNNKIDTCTLIRKSALQKVGFYSNYMSRSGVEDWELWVKMGISGSKFVRLKKVGFYYRVRSNSVTEIYGTPQRVENKMFIINTHLNNALNYLRSTKNAQLNSNSTRHLLYQKWDHLISKRAYLTFVQALIFDTWLIKSFVLSITFKYFRYRVYFKPTLS